MADGTTQQTAEDSGYDEATQKLQGFLTSFTEEDVISGESVFKYMRQLLDVANRKVKSVDIELDDIFASLGEDMAHAVRSNTIRYKRIIADAIDEVMPAPTETDLPSDVHDVLFAARQTRLAAASAAGTTSDADDGGLTQNNALPKMMRRRYDVRIIPRAKEKAMAIRQVKASHIGTLVTIKGIVTRVAEVKPMMRLATYTCEQGGTEVYQEITGTKFMPLFTCPNDGCCTNGRLRLQTRGSKFEKFQEVKIQEEPDQVPQGHVPRCMTVHLNGDLTRTCSAGDTLTISGIFLPVPYTGYQALRAGLITNTFFEAMSIEKHKKSHHDFQASQEIQDSLDALYQEGDVYERLSQSIAPEIFGHDDVKKALLLLMVGGATRKVGDGMKIRGDVNICLMGDPGVAKSQLLKHIATIAPRAIYTTGKGSSGVGLTAAVIRDPVTSELVLEGGALVLSDMGICCIDEFDKMEEADRTAIHEVMEQQTVSIAKAGITTTLNARTSVLAAANPAYSRYNPNRSPEENINLPAALLSRFDLLWLILDKPDHDFDKRLAQHVTFVHQFSTHPPLEFEPLEAPLMRAFISDVRKLEPSVQPDVAAYVVDEYVSMRKEAQLDGDSSAFGFTSARTLLAILRLSQALARLRRSAVVSREDVVEARRLMSLSKASITESYDSQNMPRKDGDAVSAVYHIIREHIDRNKGPAVYISDILPMVVSRGRTQDDLDKCIAEYEQLGVWQLMNNGTVLRFVDDGDDADMDDM